MLALVGHGTVGVVGHVDVGIGCVRDLAKRWMREERGDRSVCCEAGRLLVRSERLVACGRVQPVDTGIVPPEVVARDAVLEAGAWNLKFGWGSRGRVWGFGVVLSGLEWKRLLVRLGEGAAVVTGGAVLPSLRQPLHLWAVLAGVVADGGRSRNSRSWLWVVCERRAHGLLAGARK